MEVLENNNSKVDWNNYEAVPQTTPQGDTPNIAPQQNPLTPQSSNQGINWDSYESITPEDSKGIQFPEIAQASPFRSQISSELLKQGDQGIDTASRIYSGDIESVLRTYKGITPERAHEVSELAKLTGLSFDVAHDLGPELSHLGEAAKIHDELRAVDENGNSKNPNLIKWLKDPVAMLKAKDNVTALSELEQSIRDKGQQGDSFAKTQLRALEYGFSQMGGSLARIPAALYDIAKLPSNINASLLKREFGSKVPDLQQQGAPRSLLDNPIALQQDKMAELVKPAELDQDAVEKIKSGDYSGAARNLFTQVMANAPNQALIVGMGATGLEVPALGMMGLSQGASADKAAHDLGKSPLQAGIDTALQGSIEVGFEHLGTLGVLKSWENSLVENYGTTTAKGVFKEFGKQAAYTFLGEGNEEFLTSIGQDFSDYVTGNPDALNGMMGRAMNAGLVGGLSGLSMTAPIGALTATSKLNELKQNSSLYNEMESSLNGVSKSLKSDSDTHDFLHQTLDENGQPTSLFVPVEALTHFFQSNLNQDENIIPPENQSGLDQSNQIIKGNENIQGFIEQMGITPEQVKEAQTTGLLEVPTAKFMTQYNGSDLSAAIKDKIKFSPDGLSQSELAQEKERQTNIINDMHSEYQKITEENKVPESIKNLREKMMLSKDEGGFGLSAEDATANTGLLLAGIKNIAQKGGETLDEAFKRIGLDLKIGGEASQLSSEDLSNTGNLFLEQNPRGAITFGNGKTIINLFNSANLSTFLHETGHLFTGEMQRLIDLNLTDDQTKADYEALLKFADGKLDTDGHEKIARAFEAYLREGKAPTVELASAFTRFKSWLTAIYKSVKNLNVEINDDVRGVFDRILASDEEIKKAQEYYADKSSLIDMLKLDEAEKQKLIEKRNASQKSAKEKQLALAMRAYFQALGGKEEIRKQATEEINNSPVYQAIEDTTKNGSFSFEDIAIVFGDQVANKLEGKYPRLIKEGGKISLGEMAAKYNFQSEKDLIDFILAAPEKSQAIDQKVKEYINAREQEIKNDIMESDVTPGDVAVHSNASTAYLIATAQIIANKLQQEKGSKKIRVQERAYRDAARETIGEKKVSKAGRYDLFAKAEQRYAKEVLDAARKGDWEKAFAARERQILNHLMVQEAIHARDEINKIEKRYSPKKLTATLKGIENSFAEATIDLLNEYGFTEKQSKVANSFEVIKDIDRVLYDSIPAWIQNRIKPSDYNSHADLTFQQLIDLDQATRSILHFGRDSMLTLEGKHASTIQDYVARSTSQMALLPETKAPQKSNPLKYKALTAIQGISSNLTMMKFLSDTMDNYTFQKTGKFGPMLSLYHQTVDAETNGSKLMKQVFDLAHPHFVTLQDAGKRIDEKMGGRYFQVPGVPLPESMVQAGNGSWTSEMLIALMLNTGNEHNYEVVKNAYGFQDTQIEAIAKLFTGKELEAIQGLWDATNYLFDPLNDTHFKVYNRHVEKVEARPISLQSEDGKALTLKGGYYPLVFDAEVNNQAANYSEEDIMKNRQRAIFRSTKPEDGFVMGRTQTAHSLPPKLSLGVWNSHIGDTIHYITHAALMRDLNRITTNKDWVGMYESRFGKQYYKQIRDWVSYIAVPGNQTPYNWFERHLDNQRKLSTAMGLGWKFITGLKQRTGIINSAYALGGWKWIIEGYKGMHVATSIGGFSNTQAWHNIEAQSEYMKGRENAISQDIREFADRLNPNSKVYKIPGTNREFTASDVRDTAFFWLQMNDRSVVSVVWQGAFNKYMQTLVTKGTTQEEARIAAVKYADHIIQTTQPSSLKTEINQLQRSGSIISKMLSQFMSWSFTMQGRLSYNYGAWQQGAMTNSQYMNHITHEVLLEPWAQLLIGSLGAGMLPNLWFFLASPFETLVSGIPLMNQLSSYIKYKKDPTIPVFEGYRRAGKIVSTVPKVLSGDKEVSDLAWELARMGEYISGVPALNIVHEISQTQKNLSK